MRRRDKVLDEDPGIPDKVILLETSAFKEYERVYLKCEDCPAMYLASNLLLRAQAIRIFAFAIGGMVYFNANDCDTGLPGPDK